MSALMVMQALPVLKTFRGQRVVTLRDIDELHQKPDGTARRNFHQNKRHFIEGEDYFVRNSHEASSGFRTKLRPSSASKPPMACGAVLEETQASAYANGMRTGARLLFELLLEGGVRA